MDWISMVKGVVRGINQAYESVQAGTAWAGEGLNRLGMLEPIRFGAFQFIEGFKAVATFPFTALKMPFYGNTQSLIGHTFKYNVLQYALPLIAYYGVMRRLLEGENGEIAPYLIVVDLCANAIFARAMVNAYAMNVLNNLNATTMRLPGSDEFKNMPSCECPESKKLRGSLMSPAYYAGKIILPSLLSKIPFYGSIFEYTLKPLAIGENLAEVNLGEMCTEDRVIYFSTHNMSSYGMGVGAMIALKTTTGIIYYFTGVNGFFLEDAILCTLMPFMLFHMNTSRFPDEIRSEAVFETFYPIRKMVDAGVARAAHSIIPRMKVADENGRVLEYLTRIWKSRPVRFTRHWVLDRKLHRDFQTFGELGPINLLIKENYELIQEKLKLIDLVLQYPGTVENGLWLYNLLPFLPPKDHVAIIVSILTKNTAVTRKYLALLREWLDHAHEYDPRYPGGFKITHPMRVHELLDSYYATDLSIDPIVKTEANDQVSKGLPTLMPVLRQRHFQQGHHRSQSDGEVSYPPAVPNQFSDEFRFENKPMPSEGISPISSSDDLSGEEDEWILMPQENAHSRGNSLPLGLPALVQYNKYQDENKKREFRIIDNYLNCGNSTNNNFKPR